MKRLFFWWALHAESKMKMFRNIEGVRIQFATAALAAILATLFAPTAEGQSSHQAPPSVRFYSMEEYNSFAKASGTQDPAEKIEQLKAFISKYPGSTLLGFVYQSYVSAYNQLGNLPKVLEYAQKSLSSDGVLDIDARFELAIAAVSAYNCIHSKDTGLADTARGIALSGLELIPFIKRPLHMDEKTFATEMKKASVYLNATIVSAAMEMKDYKSVSESLAVVIALTTYDPSELQKSGNPGF